MFGGFKMSGKLLNYEVVKRTFEGIIDETKNNSPVTSKYMSSQKYIALYNIQWDHGGISEMNKCYTTKKKAIEDMEFIKQYGIK
jgi:hypothetical protein